MISLVMYIPVKFQKNKNKNKNEIPGLQETLQLLESCFQVNESMRLSVAPNDEIPLKVLKIHFRLSKYVL